jgi:hypothetical protein
MSLRNVVPFLRPIEVSVSVPEPLFNALVAAVQEYRDEAEGLGMPRTVAQCDRLLAKAKAV